MDISEARERMGEVLARVECTRRPVVLTSDGRDVGAFLPLQMYRALIEEREALFEELAQAVAKQPQYPEEEVERDIAQAIAAVRGKGAASRI
ncbi:MAG TPA: type II toxin-antitoxin system Phd/YefM family antitoxin [Longimicrobium sp.]|jgi:prevent-host-death family protein